MRERGILLHVTEEAPSIYTRRGLLLLGGPQPDPTWTPAPAAATAQAPPVRVPHGRSAPMRTASASAPAVAAAVDALIQRWYKRAADREVGREAQKKLQHAWSLQI
jgi:hypothetical protein